MGHPPRGLDSFGNADASVCGDGEGGIPGDFPEKPVWIGEVAGVAAPESFMGRPDEFCASGYGLVEHGVNFGASAGVVGQRNSAETFSVGRNVGVLREFLPRIKRERHSPGLKKCDAV